MTKIKIAHFTLKKKGSLNKIKISIHILKKFGIKKVYLYFGLRIIPSSLLTFYGKIFRLYRYMFNQL